MESPGACGSSCQVVEKYRFGRSPGRKRQISSAVKERMGASQRTMLSAM